jgi:molybdopterin molybdotransferase
VGDLDLVKPALEQAGAKLDFIKVALKPGKPLMAGKLGDALVLGLPGNPVSAYVTALLFALPLARRLMGAASPLPAASLAPLGEDVPAAGSRTEFLRALVEDGRVWPLTNQDSAALYALSNADVLIRRDAGAPPASAGTLVKTIMLD